MLTTCITVWLTISGLAGEGRAVLVITHDLEWAWEHAKKAALMERGRVVGTGDIGLLASGLASRLNLTPALASLDAAVTGGSPASTPKALAAAIAARHYAKAGTAPDGRK